MNGQKGRMTKGAQENFWGDGCVHCLDCGHSHFHGKYTYVKFLVKLYILNMYSLFLNFTKKKKANIQNSFFPDQLFPQLEPLLINPKCPMQHFLSFLSFISYSETVWWVLSPPFNNRGS
jgi:hypothetical protein